MRHYTYTGGKYAEPEPERTERHEWARQWCEIIADEIGGLDVYGHQMLYLIMHEMRRRVEAGDYTHPERIGPERELL